MLESKSSLGGTYGTGAVPPTNHFGRCRDCCKNDGFRGNVLDELTQRLRATCQKAAPKQKFPRCREPRAWALAVVTTHRCWPNDGVSKEEAARLKKELFDTDSNRNKGTVETKKRKREEASSSGATGDAEGAGSAADDADDATTRTTSTWTTTATRSEERASGEDDDGDDVVPQPHRRRIRRRRSTPEGRRTRRVGAQRGGAWRKYPDCEAIRREGAEAAGGARGQRARAEW